MKDEKLILKIEKNYKPCTDVIRVNPAVAERVRAIASEVNKDYSTIACELLEFALDRVEIIDWCKRKVWFMNLNMGGLKADLTINGLDDSLEKLNRYLELLKEARSIAYELANIELNMKFTKDGSQED